MKLGGDSVESHCEGEEGTTRNTIGNMKQSAIHFVNFLLQFFAPAIRATRSRSGSFQIWISQWALLPGGRVRNKNHREAKSKRNTGKLSTRIPGTGWYITRNTAYGIPVLCMRQRTSILLLGFELQWKVRAPQKQKCETCIHRGWHSGRISTRSKLACYYPVVHTLITVVID